MHSRLGSQLWGCSEVEEVKESTGAGGISTYRLVAECFVAFSLVHVELVLTYALLRYHITFDHQEGERGAPGRGSSSRGS